MTGNGLTSYVYDDENRLIATAGYSYIYDGDGERVEKCTEGTTPGTCATSATGTMYWRGAGSDPLTETDLSGNVQNTYIFFNGTRVARNDSTGAVHYYFSDHLGTHGVVENATGSACEQDVDYYPYGGEENDYCTTQVAQNYKFTGKERDSESGLDNFGARFNASNLGRFMTPDWAAKPISVPYAKFGDPQTLNLYAYVENSPLNRIDADGHGDDNPSPDNKGTDADREPASCQLNTAGGGGSCLNPAAQTTSSAAAAPALPLAACASGGCEAAAAGVGAGVLAVLPAAAMGAAIVLPIMDQGDPMTPGYVPAPPVTGTPASTSQQGAVDTSPIQSGGGGKTDRKVNQGRAETAADQLTQLRGDLARLQSTPNKTPAVKEEIKRVQGQINRQVDRQRKSEEHARQGQQ
jgi:RHS repeat-associated protein